MAKRMALSFFFKYLFIRLLWWYMGCFSCGMWDLVPGPGIEPGHPALGACSLSHWITREVSIFFFFFLINKLVINFMKFSFFIALPVFTEVGKTLEYFEMNYERICNLNSL